MQHVPRTVALGLLALASTSPAGVEQTRHLVLVTLDGVRVEEMFGGLDAAVLRHGLPPGARLEDSPAWARYWAPTREGRRLRLMPFLWGTLLRRHGSIAGDSRSGSADRVTNAFRSSYPGYSELLTGRAHDDVVTGNDLGQTPYASVLEFLRWRLGVPREQVAVFASWGTMARIAEHVPGTILVDAGEAGDSTRTRADAETMELALDYLERARPRVLYVSLDETDELAHEGRYTEVLDALARTDAWLERLWDALQADAEYRDSTALVITTDHGRGRSGDHWHQHGRGVAGAEDVWTAFVVPEARERGIWRHHPTLTHDQLAATLARLMGQDYVAADPTAAPETASLF